MKIIHVISIILSIISFCALTSCAPVYITDEDEAAAEAVIKKFVTIMEDEKCDTDYNNSTIVFADNGGGFRFSGIIDLLITPASDRIITADTENRIKIWDIKTGRFINHLITAHTIQNIHINNTAKYLIATGITRRSIGWLTIFDLTTNSVIKTIQAHRNRYGSAMINSVEISKDSKYVITGSDNGEVKVWDLSTGFMIREIDTDGEKIKSIALDQSRNYLYISRFDTIEIRDFKSGKLIRNLFTIRNKYLVIIPDSDQLLTAAASYNPLIWTVDDWDYFIRLRKDRQDSIKSMSLALEKDTLILETDNREFEIWSLQRLKKIYTIPIKLPPYTETWIAAISSDLKYVVVLIGATLKATGIGTPHPRGKLSVWNINEGKELYRVSHRICSSTKLWSEDHEDLRVSNTLQNKETNNLPAIEQKQDKTPSTEHKSVWLDSPHSVEIKEPEMVKIKGGCYKMGNYSFDDESPEHQVCVNDFYIGKYEITFDEYQLYKLLNTGKTHHQEDAYYRYPATKITWHDALKYTRWLSSQTGIKYRLPTEAEWEYAARAGSTGDYYWTGKISDICQYANGYDISSHLYLKEDVFSPHNHCDDQYATMAPVGSFRPNRFGLHDTLGNAWEWVQDCYHKSYSGAPSNGDAWLDATGCRHRAVRGTSWATSWKYMRLAKRSYSTARLPDSEIGFRVARDIE